MAPIYHYKAVQPSGKNVKGTVEAPTPKEARTKIKKQGLMIVDMMEADEANRMKSSSSLPFFGSRVSQKEISLFTRQLASLIKSNIPLVASLNALVDQTEGAGFKTIISQVRDEVNQGSSLAKALSAHPKTFDTIFVNMVEAGESSGTLGLVLVKLAELKEAQLRLKNKIVSGTTYPALMLAVSFFMVIGIFTFVIPNLTKVLISMNRPIPTSTRFLIWVSGMFVNYWYLIILAVVGFGVFFKRYIESDTGKPHWHAALLKLPVIGPLIRIIAVTRFANTMSTLLGSGVPILNAMSIAKNLVGNLLIAKAIEDARANITEGQSIADPLRKSGEFPPMVIHMISIGEKTGELPEMLKNISTTYEEQVNARIDQFTSLLEPIMIIGMGGIVGMIVLSVFLPILEMTNTMR